MCTVWLVSRYKFSFMRIIIIKEMWEPTGVAVGDNKKKMSFCADHHVQKNYSTKMTSEQPLIARVC